VAKKRASTRGKPKVESRRRWWWRVPLVILLLGLLFWFRASIWELFGWGLIIVSTGIGALAVIFWKRRFASLTHHWNRYLGGVTFAIVVWGLLAFYDLGGSLGLSIIGYSVFFGALRIAGLLAAGIVLVAPRACFRLAANATSWASKQLSRKPVPRPAPQQKPELLSATLTPRPPEVEPEREVSIPVVTLAPVVTPSQAQPELRQVAQEVWKKYGESPSLITVDGWQLPPIDILDKSPELEFSQADNMQRARLIEEALASYGVEAKVVQINAGPTVTQFGVEPGWDRKMKEIKERDKDGSVRVRLEEVSRTRVKVDRITSLANDLTLALAAPSIRIEAPVPGKSVVGIEVPNTVLGMVGLRGVIETSGFQKLEAKSRLSLALGKGAGGEAVAADLCKMPHLLIAGATGSGKTVCLNSTICCLLLHNTPNDARFIMIDPKRVELVSFNSIPHLASPVIVDTDKALSALRWLNQEMDNRYRKLAAAGARNIEGYNRTRQGDDKFPYLVLVIDELADLMMAGFDEVEHILCRLAQLARAVGIHLIVATQRPSVDVVTGLIKANFPTRISFAVTSQVDSRTILDMAGAEKLLGSGDMLYMPTEAAKPKRLQGCYVSDAELERLVYFWGGQQKEESAPLKIEELAVPRTAAGREAAPEDALLESARELLQEHKHISTSFLQRKLRIGYPRAARIMEQLQEEGTKREGGEF